MSGISKWADREEFEFRKKNDKREREGTDNGHHQNL